MLDFEQAWNQCTEGRFRVWLVACGGLPIESIIESSAEVLLFVAEESGVAVEQITRTIEAAVALEPSEVLKQMAQDCELIETECVGGYREERMSSVASMARAAAALARAADGLIAGSAAREARRVDHARQQSAMVGIGPSGILPPNEGLPRLELLSASLDPAQGMFLFCVASCAEAIREAQRAAFTASGAENEHQRYVDGLLCAALSRQME